MIATAAAGIPQAMALQPPGTMMWVIAESEWGERFPGLLLRMEEGGTGVLGHPVPVHVRMGLLAYEDVYPVVLMVSTMNYLGETWINLAHDDAREWMALLGRGQPIVLSFLDTSGRVARTILVSSEDIAPIVAAIVTEVRRVGSTWSGAAFDQAKAAVMEQYTLAELWELLGSTKEGNGHGC